MVNHAGKHCVYYGISDVHYCWYLVSIAAVLMSVVRSQPGQELSIYSGVHGFIVRQFVHEGQLIKKGIRFI